MCDKNKRGKNVAFTWLSLSLPHEKLLLQVWTSFKYKYATCAKKHNEYVILNNTSDAFTEEQEPGGIMQWTNKA